MSLSKHNPELFPKSVLNALDVAVIETTPVAATSLSKDGWSLDACKAIASKWKIPSDLTSATQQREIVIRFLNFYCHGNYTEQYPVQDVILAAAHLIYKDEAVAAVDLVWSNEYYTANNDETAFNIAGRKAIISDNKEAQANSIAVDRLEDLGDTHKILFTIEDAPEQPKEVRVECNLDALVKKAKSQLRKQVSGGLMEFAKICNDILASSSAESGLNRMQIELFRVVNFLALVMLRRVVKTDQQMITGFSKKSLIQNIITLIGGPAANKVVPPCDTCLTTLGLSINKGNKYVRSTFAKIIYFFWVENQSDKNLTGILGASVLTHTAWNGLGILDMLLFTVCDKYKVTWRLIMNLSCITHTVTTWSDICLFLIKYQTKGNRDLSVPWARLVDDAYFSNYSISRHAILASILIESLIATQGDRGALDAVWATQNRHHLDYYREASEWLRDEISGHNTPAEAAMKESIPLLARLRPRQTVRAAAEETVSEDVDPDEIGHDD